MKEIPTLLLAFLIAAGAAGCVVHDRRGPHSGVECVVPLGHGHDDLCGHYHFGGRWYFIQDHRHSPSCGHVLVEGSWTVGH